MRVLDVWMEHASPKPTTYTTFVIWRARSQKRHYQMEVYLGTVTLILSLHVKNWWLIHKRINGEMKNARWRHFRRCASISAEPLFSYFKGYRSHLTDWSLCFWARSLLYVTTTFTLIMFTKTSDTRAASFSYRLRHRRGLISVSELFVIRN